MNYIEDMYRTLDKIMNLQHNIMTTIINMAENEVKRRTESPISEGLLKKEFERLREYYL